MRSIAIDSSSLLRAFGQSLAETEWLAPEDLHAYQLPLLSKMLSHARQTTDFYRERLDHNLTSHEEIENAWSAIPILTRVEALANGERLVSRSVPSQTGISFEGVTSGSVGMPLPYRRSEIAVVAAQAMTERMMHWWHVDSGKPMARISFDATKQGTPPHGAVLSGWHSTNPEAKQFFLSTEADVLTQIDWLAARRPAYLASYSNVLKELAYACQRSGTRLEFELLLSFGTVVDDEAREACRTAFGVEIADTYGVGEIGQVASQCAECGEYHIGAEAVLFELLRADGSAARPGEIGRVIVTSLYNYAMPLIRYEVGDLAEAGSEQAPCGRGLPSLRRILGRYRNAFRFRNGKIVFPHTHDFKLWNLLSFKQAQMVQLDPDHIEIRWVPDGADQPVDLAALTDRVRSVLGEPVEVSICKVDVIERSPSGKFEDCVSLVTPDWPFPGTTSRGA